MKSSKVHSILGEVYRLLGDYTAAEFAEASRYKGIAPPLRDVLRALTNEASGGAPSQSAVRTPARPSQASAQMSPSASPFRGPDPTIEIADMIRQTKRFDSTQSILRFAKEAGLTVLPRPKESRERLAKRVAGAILLTREPRRSQIVGQLASNGDTQTQGWIDAIKNPRL
jgi:hypothetical protein